MAGKLKNLARARAAKTQREAQGQNAWFAKQPKVVQRLLLEMSGQNEKGQRFGAVATIQAVAEEARRQLEYGPNAVVSKLAAFCDRVAKEYEAVIADVTTQKKETA